MEQLGNAVSLLSDFSIFLATVFGGLWALYVFKLSRQDKPTPQLGLKYSVVSYNSGHYLLVMEISVKNVGKYDMYPKKINLSVQRLEKSAQAGGSPHWDSNRNSDRFLLENYDVVLDANPGLSKEDAKEYMLPPNDEYVELATLVISKEEDFLLVKISYLDTAGSDFWIYKFLQIR